MSRMMHGERDLMDIMPNEYSKDGAGSKQNDIGAVAEAAEYIRRRRVRQWRPQ